MSRRAAQAPLALASESLVVTLAIGGDVAAFAELVARREAGLRDLLRRLCGERELGDDLAQQAFVTAWRKLPGLRQPGAFAGWLRRIAVNTWLQHARRGRLLEGELTDYAVAAASRDVGIEAAADHRIDLERALSQLRPAERLCVVLAHAEGLSHGEIAETTGFPLGTVKSHVARGSARLRALLDIGERND